MKYRGMASVVAQQVRKLLIDSAVSFGYAHYLVDGVDCGEFVPNVETNLAVLVLEKELQETRRHARYWNARKKMVWDTLREARRNQPPKVVRKYTYKIK